VVLFAAAHMGFLALLGPREMSDLRPQSETKQTLIRSLSPTSQFYEYAALIAKNDRFAPLCVLKTSSV
jgi:hypothetical protein